MDVDFSTLTLRFAEPLKTSYGDLSERSLVMIRLAASDGVIGWGEAAPLEAYDGVAEEAVRGALAAYEPILRNGDGASPTELLERCRDATELPQALAAVDMALWDMAGNREGKPVSQMLADDPAESVRVNAMIGAEDRAQAAAQAAAAARDGFTCVKLKVGIGDDAGRVPEGRLLPADVTLGWMQLVVI